MPQWGGTPASSRSLWLLAGRRPPPPPPPPPPPAALAGPARRRPAGVEAVGGGDGEQADVSAVFRHQADGLDRLRRDRAGVGDDNLTIGPGPAQPIGAVDDRLTQLQAHRPFYLLDRPRLEAQVDTAAGLSATPSSLR